MLPKPILQDVEQDANVLVMNVQYQRQRKKDDGSYTPDKLYVVYRDLDTGKKKLQIIHNPSTDIYVTKEEYRNTFKTPREYVSFDKVDKHTITYRDRERYLYNVLSKNILSEEDKIVKSTIDRANELGKWNGKKEVHKWRNTYFSDYDIEDYVYMTANLYYKPEHFKFNKSYLDIETDVYGKTKYEHETGKCDISAITLIYDYSPDGKKEYKPRVYTLLYRNHKRYPQQEEFEANIDKFTDRLHREFDKKYGVCDFKIIFFDRQDELLLTAFKFQHLLKPDFTGIWNMSYDILYMQKRAIELDIPPEALFCHPDFGDTMFNYRLDERYKGDFKNRGDSFNCLSYTKYVDQMLTYAARRKGGQDYGSNGIDNIASIEMKEKKHKFDKPGTTVINAAIEEYENFVFYSITDVLLQMGIERKVEDIDDVFLKGYDSGTRIDKSNRQTVSLKNLWILSHFNHGYIMGNNLNTNYVNFGEQDEEVEDDYVEKLKGALVGDPTFIENIGVEIFNNKKSNRIFLDLIDLDATSMYPSINLVNNISRSSQLGRLIILNKVSPLEYSVNPHLRGGEFVDDYETRDYIKIGIKWFGLKRTEHYLKEYVKYNDCKKIKFIRKKGLGEFFNLWSYKMISIFKNVFPENNGNVKSFLKMVFDRDVKDVDCIIYNNYENIEYDTTLLSVVDWIVQTKPILTESGTFFRRHEEGEISPGLLTTNDLIKKRKTLKGVEIEYEKQGNKEMARIFNLKQNRVKIYTNSAYGVSGAVSSAFYSFHTAQSTTSKGQTIISLAMTSFEDFITDTIQFYDMDELLHYCDNVINEAPTFNDSDILSRNKTVEEVKNRLLRKCKNIKKLDMSILEAVLKSAPQHSLNRLYYKSNLMDFIQENDYIQDAIHKFGVNTPVFLNPNSPPKDGQKFLKSMTNVILEYCQYNYPYYGRVDRLINTKRKSVVLIDTDSNIICVHALMNKLREYMDTTGKLEIVRKNGRNKVKEGNRLRAMNTVAYILTEVITRVLDKFKYDTNVENHPFGVYQMKNEFGILSLLLASGKKRYLQSIILREGEYLWPPKQDVKGFDFKKISAAPKYVRDTIEKVLFDHVVTDDIDIAETLRKFMKLEEYLTERIKEGDKEYFTEAKVNTIDSYKDPMGTGTFKAAYIWNELYPDKEITLPNSIHLVKINIKSAKDIADLAMFDKDMFDRVVTLLGDPKMKTGITQIAIPLDSEVPKWILDRMATDIMVNKNMNLVTPLLEEIGVRSVYKRQSEKHLSSIVEIG